MENVNFKIACDVTECRHNYDGCNCTLDKIHVGCACGEKCTCCESFADKN